MGSLSSFNRGVSYLSKMQKWLHDNDILIYSTHNEGKSAVAERFINALKNKIFEKNDSS